MSTTTAEATALEPRAHRTGQSQDIVAGILLASPAVLGLILFVGIPFVIALALSLFNAHLNSPVPAQFVGIKQYSRLFTDPDFRDPFLLSLLHNLTFAVVVVPLQTALALALAILLNRKLPGISFFRTFYFMPVVFPMALVAIIWRLILSRGSQGLLNALLSQLSFGHLGAQNWLGSPSTALGSVILLSIWQGVGFQMIIVLAGLQEIPHELYEASALDGATRWQQFRHVTLPGLRNTLVFVAMITSILAFRVFDQIYVLVRGGGLNPEASTTVMYQAVTTAFDEDNVGQGAAITVVFFVIVLTLTFLQRRLVRPDSEEA